jgi:hypothetical protein
VRACNDLGAALVIVISETGYTARLCAKYRPHVPVICVTSNSDVATYLTLSRGVIPIVCRTIFFFFFICLQGGSLLERNRATFAIRNELCKRPKHREKWVIMCCSKRSYRAHAWKLEQYESLDCPVKDFIFVVLSKRSDAKRIKIFDSSQVKKKDFFTVKIMWGRALLFCILVVGIRSQTGFQIAQPKG